MRVLLIFIFIFSTYITALAQSINNTSSPKLVLFINVDELHTEHLLALKNKFSQHGFNQLVNQGSFFHSADYESLTTYKGTRLLNMYSGAYPEVHGVISDLWFTPNSNDTKQAFEFMADKPEVRPDSGSVKLNEFLSSTIADELSLFYMGRSKIASIGLSPEDNAFFTHSDSIQNYWFDRTNGFMVSESEKALPEWVNNFNKMDLSGMYASRQWGPLSDLKKYQEYLSVNKEIEPRHFMYDLKYKDNVATPYQKLVGSPYGNVLVRDFAAALILNEEFGKDEYPDLLSVSFTCKPFTNPNPELFDAELEDMLLRLDGQIESLIQLISDNVGLEHTLIVLSSTPTLQWSPETLNENNLSGGYFNGRKTSALLNLYLMAIYGQGKWIKGYHDKQFYLNHALIKKSGIALEEIQAKASGFLLEVSGIQNTISAHLLRTNNYTSGIYYQMQKSFYYGRSGDLFISLKPGWTEEVDTNSGNEMKGQRFNIPLMFFGWQVPSIQIFRKIKMIQVAPTISAILGIPRPNGASGEPIHEIVK